MALIELIVLALAAASAVGFAFRLYRRVTRPGDDERVSPAGVPPIDDPSEPEPPDPSPVELL